MNIENSNHAFNPDGPGKVWEPKENDQRIFKPHTSVIGELLSDSHYDVFVRYGYAKSLVDGQMGHDYNFWKTFYDQMQQRRVGVSKTERFDELLKSFERQGFDPNFPIPIDENYGILDGSHRLASSAVFDLRPRVMIYNTSSHSYGKDWFESQDFSDEQILEAEKVRQELLDKYSTTGDTTYVGIVWGTALEYWDEIIGTLDPKILRRAFIKNFKDKIEGFIKESYISDGMSNDRIDNKAKVIAGSGSQAGFIVLDGSPEAIADIKREVRSRISSMMDNYFYDNIIHVIDNQKFGGEFLKKHDLKNKG